MSRNSGPNVFQRGVMALILLSLLRREDMYGYQLVQEIERCSGGQLKTQEGSLYPVLYRLQEQGLISDRRVLVGNRRLLENHGVDVPSRDYENRYAKDGRQLVYLSTAGELSAMFVVSYIADEGIAQSLHSDWAIPSSAI